MPAPTDGLTFRTDQLIDPGLAVIRAVMFAGDGQMLRNGAALFAGAAGAPQVAHSALNRRTSARSPYVGVRVPPLAFRRSSTGSWCSVIDAVLTERGNCPRSAGVRAALTFDDRNAPRLVLYGEDGNAQLGLFLEGEENGLV